MERPRLLYERRSTVFFRPSRSDAQHRTLAWSPSSALAFASTHAAMPGPTHQPVLGAFFFFFGTFPLKLPDLLERH